YPLREGMTARDAIAAAGGFRPDSFRQRVTLHRITLPPPHDSHCRASWTLDLGPPDPARGPTSTLLQPGHILNVPAGPYSPENLTPCHFSAQCAPGEPDGTSCCASASIFPRAACTCCRTASTLRATASSPAACAALPSWRASSISSSMLAPTASSR